MQRQSAVVGNGMTTRMSCLGIAVSALQVYGYQSMKEGASSEQILGRVAKESGQHCVLGTKFFTASPSAPLPSMKLLIR